MSEPQILLAQLSDALVNAQTVADVQELRRKHTGKKSPAKLAMRGLGKLEPDVRAAKAKELQQVMASLNSALDQRENNLKPQALNKALAQEWQDPSLPGVTQPRGGHHPVTEVERRAMEVLRQLGFEIVDGPEVEDPFYNFDALNIPEHHPARDMQDTFWVDGGKLLRSHTTTVQARVLQSGRKPPFQVASLGRVYRNEAVDATHTAMFHQLEGVWLQPGLTIAHLKGILQFIAKRLYGEHPIRFKPKFYPYTEPSVGVDLQCGQCHGKGCDACHGAGWITILGSGMVHPKVLRQFGYDPTQVQGLAFGLGITRMAAQWANITKSRSLYETDLRVHERMHRPVLEN